MFVYFVLSMIPSPPHAGRERLFLMPIPVPFLSIFFSPYEYPALPLHSRRICYYDCALVWWLVSPGDDGILRI